MSDERRFVKVVCPCECEGSKHTIAAEKPDTDMAVAWECPICGASGVVVISSGGDDDEDES